MIQVVNKYKHIPTSDDLQIGRPSPFGNPYSHLPNTLAKYRVNTREEAVKSYENYLPSAYHNDPKIYALIHEIAVRVMMGKNVNLVCYCKPKSCHGDVIKKFVERLIEDIHNLK
jgi:hypothetical protein